MLKSVIHNHELSRRYREAYGDISPEEGVDIQVLPDPSGLFRVFIDGYGFKRRASNSKSGHIYWICQHDG